MAPCSSSAPDSLAESPPWLGSRIPLSGRVMGGGRMAGASSPARASGSGWRPPDFFPGASRPGYGVLPGRGGSARRLGPPRRAPLPAESGTAEGRRQPTRSVGEAKVRAAFGRDALPIALPRPLPSGRGGLKQPLRSQRPVSLQEHGVYIPSSFRARTTKRPGSAPRRLQGWSALYPAPRPTGGLASSKIGRCQPGWRASPPRRPLRTPRASAITTSPIAMPTTLYPASATSGVRTTDGSI